MSAWAEETAVGTYSRFTFTAPRDTLITGYTLYRYERARSSGGAIGLVEYADGHGASLDGCGSVSGSCVHGSQDPALRLAATNRTSANRSESRSADHHRAGAPRIRTPRRAVTLRSGAWISIYGAQIDFRMP